MTRYLLDGDARRSGTTVIGGSPLRLFRLTTAGTALVDRIAAGDDVADSVLTERLLDAGVIHPCPGRRPARFGADDVTVVVPTLGPPGATPPGAVVVDDGSTPPVVGATIRLDTNCGPGGARNAGLAVVTTPLVAFVDADVDLTPGWLDRLVPLFDDDRVALVAPRVRSRPGPGRLAGYERRHGPLDLGARPARIRAGTRVSYVPAAAIVCRTDAVRSVGGFDERLRFGEDVDLVWRLDAAGHRCRYEPTVVVAHHPRPTWTAWAGQRVDYGSSAAPLARRHPRALAPLRAGRWSLAVWALAVAGRPRAALVVALGSAVTLARSLPDVPTRVSLRLVLTGHGRAGTQIAAAVRRAWWPILLVAALRSRRARWLLAGAFALTGNPLRAADDVAYSVGVWRGVARERELGPLVPLPSRG